MLLTLVGGPSLSADDPIQGLTTVRTRFYAIHTDLSSKELGDIPTFLDQMFLVYARIFRYGGGAPAPLDVYVFSTSKGFVAFAERQDVAGADQRQGFFNQWSGVLACYGSGLSLRKTLAYYGTYQFLPLVVGSGRQPPMWFRVGLATYLQEASWERGKLALGAVKFRWLKELETAKKQGRLVSLPGLLRTEQAGDFTSLHFAEAWSFIHFLLNGQGGRNADVLNTYFLLIQQGETPTDALADACRLPVDTVQQAWLQYVDELLAKRPAYVTQGMRVLRTRFYAIHTDLSDEELGSVPAFLDEMFGLHTRIFRPTPQPPGPLGVYIFSTRDGFLACAESEDVAGVEHRQGFFDHWSGDMACYGTGPDLRKTLAYYGTYQFISLVVKSGRRPPMWFQAGLVAYLQGSSWEGGRVTLGTVNWRHLKELAKAKEGGQFIPLLALFHTEQAQEFTPLDSAEAWSLVHFLLQADGGRNADVLSSYFTLMQQGGDPADAFAKASRAPLGRIEDTWLVYVDELLAKRPADPTRGLTTVRTRFYAIHTDLPGEELGDIRTFLDEMFQAYARIFHYTQQPPAPLDVYIFRTRPGFIAYGEREGVEGMEHKGGFFNEGLNVIACHGSGPGLRQILAHEGTHQFTALVTTPGHRPPTWFKEGLATYLETASWEGRTLTLGALNRGRLEALAKAKAQGEFIPLRELFLAEEFTLIEDEGPVTERISLCYAEAWSFVHFLVQAEGGRNADVLNRYFILIQQGEDPADAFARAFRAPLDKIEEAWRAYIDELLKKLPTEPMGKAPAQKTAPAGGTGSAP